MLTTLCVSMALAFSSCSDDKSELKTIGNDTSKPSVTGGIVETGLTRAIVEAYFNEDVLTQQYTAPEYGIEYDTLQTFDTPHIVKSKDIVGRKYTVELTNLRPSTIYYYRSYVILPGQNRYLGNTQHFTTQSLTFPNGLVAVDLGLDSGTCWANMNVGAKKPEDYGLYFAWGETIGYTSSDSHSFDFAHYKWCNGTSKSLTKYCTDRADGIVDNKTTLDLEDDAARANWGGEWIMPTRSMMEELLEYTTSEWITVNDISGYKLTSKINGNSIFLPAAGVGGEKGGIGDRNYRGWYLSSSMHIGRTPGRYGHDYYSNGNASLLHFAKNFIRCGGGGRQTGGSVRPVLKIPNKN